MLPLLLLLALAQKDAKIPDPDPEVERKSFKVADGFEVNLFASDPLLAKPVQICFDAAGRLWVASSEAYPQIKPGQKANDRILVLEDTKGAGKADKVTVFSDGLLIPTGIEVGDGGVYLVNSTDLEHHSDPKGTGKATRKRVVLSGFGTEDTHHMVHTLRWGHDGSLYFNQSVYIHSHIETPHGPRRLGGGGIWQFRPDTLKLEVFTRGMINPWGHHFDRWGQSFATDGAGFQGVQPQIPGGTYFWAAGAVRVLEGVNNPSPKYCGCEIVSGRHLPDDWQGDLITCDFRGHRVVRFKLSPNGSGYSARLMPDVIRSTHPAFRPIDVRMGPDGAIYVADWYNPIIQHGEVDFRDPRRDQTRGRIWRITARGRKTLPNPGLTKRKPDELVQHLESPEGWTRHFARRQLWELGAKKSLPAVEAWKPTGEPEMLEKLWTLQTLGKPDAALLKSLLEAKDHRVRAAAVRVLGAWIDAMESPLTLLDARVADEHPQVRLEALCALRGIKSAAAAESAMRAMDRPMDQYVDYSLWLTMRELEEQWLPALASGKLRFGGDARRLAFALEAVGGAKVLGPLRALVKSGKLEGEAEDGVLALLARAGTADDAAAVLSRAADRKASEARRLRLAAALEQAATERGVVPGNRKEVVDLLQQEGRARAAFVRLAGIWKVTEARNVLAGLVEGKVDDEVRWAAIAALASTGGVAQLHDMAKAGSPMPVRWRAVVALAGASPPAAAGVAAELLAEDRAEGAADLFDAFVSRKGGGVALAKALADRKLPADVARIGVRAVRASGRDDPALLEALTRAGGLSSPKRALTAEEMKALVADVKAKGDPARGEAVYRRADMQCLKCHALGGAGGAVGPDLSSIGGSAQVDYLVESLLLPSKAVKEGYHALLVTDVDGKQHAGVKVRETKDVVVLRTSEDREVSIPVRKIEKREPSKVSLMPDGLVDPLTRGELIDLVRFLSDLGKEEKYRVGRERVARRWQYLVPDKQALFVLNRKSLSALAGDEPGLTWEPAYATVSGSLPAEGLPALKGFGKFGDAVTVVRTGIEASSAAKVRLKLGEATGLTVWLDGEVVPLDRLEVTLPPGAHWLTIAIDRKSRKGPIRLEVEDTPGSASVRLISGK
jgi:putative heme-binding domain-containing protein